MHLLYMLIYPIDPPKANLFVKASKIPVFCFIIYQEKIIPEKFAIPATFGEIWHSGNQ